MSDEWLGDRPITFCPECSGEIDLTYADPGDTVVCTICGAELVVLSLDPPEVDFLVEEG